MRILRSKGLKATLLLLALVVAFTAFNTPGERYFEIARNLDIFTTLYKEVNQYYVEDVSPEDLMQHGIEAMLNSLDPYTNYIPADDYESFRAMTTGHYGGIGALIGNRNGKPVVIMPYEGFPAYQGGLQIGDRILAIDSVSVVGKTTAEISKLMKGRPYTDVTLLIERFGQDKNFEVTLQRGRIHISNVTYYGLVTDNVGYIKLSEFTNEAGKEVAQAVRALKEMGATSLMLDLRDNPGGLLNEAVNVSNVFIPKGADVVSTKGKIVEWNKTYHALNEPEDTDIPLAVLTSGNSASAAEIVAGVIQDYDRGLIIGEKTFGKGLVQSTRPLTYNAQLKITTAKYYTPSGRCLQAIDYRSRDANGKPERVPDSLKVAFSTASGRVVYDGGGVDPDVPVVAVPQSAIAKSLVQNNLIFDYASEYFFEHPGVDTPRKYALGNADYEAFMAWLANKEYSYTSKVELALTALKQAAESSGQTEMFADELQSLTQKVAKEKQSDLRANQNEISELLEQEIATRFYNMKGQVEATFDDDPVIAAAITALNDQQGYNDLLAQQ